MRRLVLGLDTSNYTTSVAVTDVDSKEILADERILLTVRPGEKGLRQSDALYQHWNNLPVLLERVLPLYGKELAAVAASEKPRAQEGSYMPVFTAGVNAARMLAAQSGMPLYLCSHQEGHIRAAAYGNGVDPDAGEPMLCAHLSGGTLELVLRGADGSVEIAGGTKDISYGQLLDRMGVDLGYPFPAGKSIDDLAAGYASEGLKNPFSRVFTQKTYLNLSGLETQLKSAEFTKSLSKETVAYFAMERIAESFCAIADEALAQTGAKTLLVTGGVACSRFLRQYCKDKNYVFGDARLCSDNAVGVSLFGGAQCR
jgi:N6-L-threonylcarbamoyladenine synthase